MILLNCIVLIRLSFLIHNLVKRSHCHKHNSSQNALDATDFISEINDLYAAREHRKLYTLLRSVSHQYLKNTLCHIASKYKSIRVEVYEIILAFFSQFCEPTKISNHIVYFTLPLSINWWKMWTLIVSWIVNQLSHIFLYQLIHLKYTYHRNMGPPLDNVFNYNKVFSSLPLYKDGDLLACDCI